MKRISVLILLSVLVGQTFCQNDFNNHLRISYPEVGKPMPDFELHDIQNFSKRTVNLRDFKGKWLVLDWWTQFCASCVESFPKVDALQREFGDKMQFMLIGYTGSTYYPDKVYLGDKIVRDIYGRARNKLGLILPIAYDSTLYQKYGLGTTPYIVVIDPKGVVRGVTTHLSVDNVKDFIEGRQPALLKAYRHDEKKTLVYDRGVPYLTYENGGRDTAFSFRSLLAAWKPGAPQFGNWYPSEGRVELLGFNLQSLFLFAFFGRDHINPSDSLYGKCYPRVVLETSDSSEFAFDFYTGKGIYSYSLIIPQEKANAKYLMPIFQKDLNAFFDLNACVEVRKMPYWRLIAKSGAKERLKAKGVFKFIDNKAAGFVCDSCKINTIIGYLNNYFQNEPPFIDETGIEENIDISINALLTDLNDFKSALNENGLDLVKGEREMKVIVIRAAKN